MAADAVTVDDQDLFLPSQRRDHGRAIAGLVPARLPNGLARLGSVGQQGFLPLLAARHHHQPPHQQGGATLAPHDVLELVLPQHVPGPEMLATRLLQAVQNPGGAHDIDPALADGGRGPRPVAAQHLVETHLVRMRPEGSAGGQVVGDGQFLFAALLLGDRPAGHYGKRRPAHPDGVPPQLARWRSGPVPH